MRAIISKMTRSIQIKKDDIDWKCRVINSKWSNFDTGETFNGASKLHYVQIKGCGKQNSDKYSLEYYNNAESHELVGSTVMESDMWCIFVKGAKMVTMTDNIVHNCTAQHARL